MDTRNHQLPAPPGQPQNFQRPEQQYNSASAQRPSAPSQSRRSRGFSFQSEKSHRSSGSKDKISLHETPAEKEAKRLHSKADPTLAMNEAEPAAVAATVKSELGNLRNMQHKDIFGNPISDPDLSNPTRSRWERPLDTIRSFEAAIDGGYNRKSYLHPDSESVANWNRRGSTYSAYSNAGRFPHESYYGSRPASMFRPENSNFDLRQGGARDNRESYFDQQPGYNSAFNNGYPPPGPQNSGRRGYPRMASEPQFNGYRQDPNVYTMPNNPRSYETVASASGSGTSGEPAGYQTDPTSSENSSIERRQSPQKRSEPVNDYGIGFSQNSAYQPSAFTVGVKNPTASGRPANNYPGGGDGYDAPPAVPQKGGILRKPTATATVAPTQQRPAPPEKRKSWFTRRFSKNS